MAIVAEVLVLACSAALVYVVAYQIGCETSIDSPAPDDGQHPRSHRRQPLPPLRCTPGNCGGALDQCEIIAIGDHPQRWVGRTVTTWWANEAGGGGGWWRARVKAVDPMGQFTLLYDDGTTEPTFLLWHHDQRTVRLEVGPDWDGAAIEFWTADYTRGELEPKGVRFGDIVEVLETGHNLGTWWPARLRYSRYDAAKGAHINDIVFSDGTAWAGVDMYAAAARVAPPVPPQPSWWSGDPTVPGNELADGPGDRWVGAAVELPTLGLDARCCLGCACDGTLPTELWQRRLPRKEDVVSDWESSRVDGLVHTDAHLTRRWDEYRIEHFDPNSRNFTARMKLPNGAGYAEHDVEVHLVKALFRVRQKVLLQIPPFSASETKSLLTWYHSDPAADVYPKADDGFRSGCRKVARPFFKMVLGLDQVLLYPARFFDLAVLC